MYTSVFVVIKTLSNELIL